MQKIKVTINKDATISYKVSGVKGKSCKDVTKFIDALSDKTIESIPTGEYYKQAPQKNELHH
jgi:hypothetical protein